MCTSQRILHRCGRCHGPDGMSHVDTPCASAVGADAESRAKGLFDPKACPAGFVQLPDARPDPAARARTACRECRLAQRQEGMEILQSEEDMLAVQMGAHQLQHVGDDK